MPPDDNDKTVFKPAGFDDPEQTSMRPRPGGRGMAPGARPQPGAQRPDMTIRPQHSPPSGAIDSESAYFRIAQGLNPLVNAASSLIAVFEKTRGSLNHPDIRGLHQRLVSEIRSFENRMRDQGTAPEIVLSARYVMCAVLDETVLNTPWGSESAWGQRTLLSVFHNEASGGEKFFLILDRMRQSPSENLNMIELMYICLSLGFEGKYRLMARGRDAIEQIRDEVFHTIRRYRGEHERELAENWRGLGRTRNTLTQFLPMWVIVVIVVSILFFSFSGFRWWLYKSSDPVAKELNTINTSVLEQIQPSDEKEEKDEPF